MQSAMTQSVALTWLGIDVSTTVPTFTRSRLTQRLVAHGWGVCGVQDRTIRKHACPGRSFGRSDQLISRIFMLVMVNTECLSRHPDRSGDVIDGIVLHYWLVFSLTDLFGQLRWANSNFTSFVLIRVVRVTIETNALTGACFSASPTQTCIYS